MKQRNLVGRNVRSMLCKCQPRFATKKIFGKSEKEFVNLHKNDKAKYTHFFGYYYFGCVFFNTNHWWWAKKM